MEKVENIDKTCENILLLPDDLDKRVEVLGAALKKERKKQTLKNIRKDLKDFFDKNAEGFKELELPLPTSIEIDFEREYDCFSIYDFVLYDSEDRIIDYVEYADIRYEIDEEYTEDICESLRECIYDSVDIDHLVELTDYKKDYRIVFGDIHNI